MQTRDLCLSISDNMSISDKLYYRYYRLTTLAEYSAVLSCNNKHRKMMKEEVCGSRAVTETKQPTELERALH
jgi:hypothetical protein